MKKVKTPLMQFVLILVLVLFFGMTQSLAESTSEDEWKFGAAIYAWLPAIEIETSSGIDGTIDLGDILDNLEMVFMGIADARKGKWTGAVDLVYMDLKNEKTLSSVEMNAWVITPSVGYAALESEQGSLNLLLGARYLYLKTEIGLLGQRVSESGSNWDGIIGIKGNVNLNKNWYMPYYLDIGTGDSDMTWQGNVGIGYRFSKFDVVLSYRYLDYEFDDDSALDNLNVSGPLLGIKFEF